MPLADIDVADLPAYRSSNRMSHAISGSLSHEYNSRNLEEGYYPAFYTMLSELFDFNFNGALTPRAQCNVFLSSAEVSRRRLAAVYQYNIDAKPIDLEASDSEESIVGDGDQSADYQPRTNDKALLPPKRTQPSREKRVDAETQAALDEAARQAEEDAARESSEAFDSVLALMDRADSPEDVAEVSFQSESTVPDGETLDNVPDFLICHSFIVSQSKPKQKNRLYAWKARQRLRTVHECFPLFVENKTSPSRRKPTSGPALEAWNHQQRWFLSHARRELLFYVALYFTRDAHAKSVVVLAASGLRWQWVELSREEAPQVSFLLPTTDKKNPTWVDDDVYMKALDKIRNSKLYMLGTKSSDRALNEMRKAVIAIVNTHTTYGPTMLSTKPEDGKGKKKGQGKDKARESEGESEGESDSDESWEEDSDEDGMDTS